MARLQRTNCRAALLDAAEAVVLEAGAAHLTLDAVAARAGVSKGGLLYHFPSKQALLEGMVSQVLARFDEAEDRAGHRLDTDVARTLKAYVLATLQDSIRPDRVSAALLAAGANHPDLLAPVREHLRRHLEQMVDSGLSFERAASVMFAVDGLWLAELLGVSPLTEPERRRVTEELLRLAGEAAR
jgi:AcrR family transcriptional regulator